MDFVAQGSRDLFVGIDSENPIVGRLRHGEGFLFAVAGKFAVQDFAAECLAHFKRSIGAARIDDKHFVAPGYRGKGSGNIQFFIECNYDRTNTSQN